MSDVKEIVRRLLYDTLIGGHPFVAANIRVELSALLDALGRPTLATAVRDYDDGYLLAPGPDVDQPGLQSAADEGVIPEAPESPRQTGRRKRRTPSA